LYQCDQLGTPIEITNSTGKTGWIGAYKAWGKFENTLEPAHLKNLFAFQGQYLDIETTLHYNRYRYYETTIRRFVGKDPIGFAGGLNVYNFAPNPAEWVDSYGLQSTSRCLTLADYMSIIAASGRDSGPHNQVAKDSHHVIQKAAMLNIPGYGKGETAYAVQLEGPPNVPGTEHYIATQSQRQKGTGGAYASERVVGYRALRRSGLSAEESRCHIMFADADLKKLGINGNTQTRIPGNRTSRGRKK
jgi:RHS repeat-associated protein